MLRQSDHAFERGLVIRITGDTMVTSPPLIAQTIHFDRNIEILHAVLNGLEQVSEEDAARCSYLNR